MQSLAGKLQMHAACGCFLALLSALPTAVAAAAANAPLDDAFFGLHIRFLDVPPPKSTRLSRWPSVTFGSWRLWNAYVDWLDIQPERNVWRFERLDRYVGLAEASGVEVLFTLGRTPRWASARPEESCGRYLGCAAEPKDLEEWRKYVRVVATRYKGRIKAYELWNEPAFSEFESVLRPDGQAKQYYSGTAAAMVQLARVAHETLKSIDPQIQLISPSVTSEGDGVGRLKAYFDAGGWRYTDIVGFHFYESPPEKIPAVAERVRALMKRYGLEGKELWNTEMGYVFERLDQGVVSQGRRARWTDVLDDATGAAFVVRALILSWHAGMSRVFWFNWDADLKEGSMGLADGGGTVVLPAGRAFNAVQRWIVGGVLDACTERSDGLWECVFRKAAKQHHLLWASTGSAVWSAPNGVCNGGTVLSVDGEVRRLSDLSSCRVTAGPVPLLISPQ